MVLEYMTQDEKSLETLASKKEIKRMSMDGKLTARVRREQSFPLYKVSLHNV
jgi:hypothetical protein